MARFRTSFLKLVPSWLSEGEGGDVLWSLGLLMDAWMERLEQGLHARFPSHAPSDALAFIGRDRRIVRGIDESAGSYVGRLLRWLDAWRRAGSAASVLGQLWGYFNTYRVRMRTVASNATRAVWHTLTENQSTSGDPADLVTKSVQTPSDWNWDGLTAYFARFYTIIYPASVSPAPFALRGTFDNVDALNRTWDEWESLGQMFDTTATASQVAGIQAIANGWKGEHNVSHWMLITFDNTKFQPGVVSGKPDGTWGNWSKDSGGVRVSSRPTADVSFWNGA